jgi:NAD+ kinase
VGMTDGERSVLLVTHAGKPQALSSARFVADRLIAAGLTVRVLSPEAAELRCPAVEVPPGPEAAVGTEIVIVVGGDGTLLRAAEVARPAGVPLLGVNLGHVGFLAEAEPDDLAWTVDRVVARHYHVERRMTIDVTLRHNGTMLAATWALNEATVEKTPRVGMLELVTEVDGRPLSRLDCDGVICATPTGSTAYAFSAGGPVVWPEVEALLLVPICAHALFAGPMVIAPASTVAVEVIGGSARTSVALPGLGVDTGHRRGEVTGAVLWCDGRRRVELPPGSRVEVRRGTRPVLLARLNRNEAGAGAGAPFTDRLVAKFELPVTGWRGRQAARAPGSADSGRAAQGERAPGEDGTAASGRAAGYGAGSDEDGTAASGRAAGGAAGPDEEEASRADA